MLLLFIPSACTESQNEAESVDQVTVEICLSSWSVRGRLAPMPPKESDDVGITARGMAVAHVFAWLLSPKLAAVQQQCILPLAGADPPAPIS